MNHPTAYTPLESLFLFQSLLTHGVEAGAFVRISEYLRNNALVKSDASFDAARLAPDALQQLFLLLLREEMKGETDPNATTSTSTANANAGEGSTSPASRKRKLGSPPLPSLKDAYEQIAKVPALVDRLYARYRDTVVKEIREDERRFAKVQKEIQLLERSEKERLAKAAASQNGGPTLAPRDGRLVPGQSSTPTPGQAGVVKRPTSTTPVYPPRPPTTSSTQSTVAAPSHLQAGTTPVRPSPSPKPPNASGSGLQAPAGMPQPGPRVLQPPGQPPKPTISPRPDATGIAAIKPKEPAPAPANQGTPASNLKWEKPYQPPPSQGPGLPGQAQPATPANAATGTAPKGPGPQQQWTPQQQQQHAGQAATATPQGRPTPGKPVLVAPQNVGHLSTPLQPAPPRPAGVAAPQGQPQPQPRPISTTPVHPPGRPIQPQQPQQTQTTPRPIAAAAQTPQKGAAGPAIAPQKWTPAQAAQQQAQRPSPSTSPAPLAQRDKPPYASPYNTQPPRPAIPEHIIRQAAAAQAAAAAATPNAKKISPVTAAPSTPGATTPIAALTRGFGTKWASHSTPSTPRPITAEPQSPAYEPVSPPPRDTSILSDTPRSSSKRDLSRGGLKADAAKARSRPSRASHRGRGMSTTPSVGGTRRSQSVASQVDELSMDHPISATKIKHEVLTPRHIEETGDTTADESVHGRTNMATPGSVSSRLAKRKRQDSPPVPTAPPTQVLWTRGFTKVSSSALDQISSHRDANMFATGVRERDAPNYRQIVLQPQDITSIRSAIKQGNKAAVQAAGSLPGGDPGTASVWLPISEDLVPPKGIVNSAQLERELVHMFCNAIMYNPDPDRGPGSAFLKRSQDEEEEVVGYRVDENGVVKNTRSMFVEVEKLLGDLRSAEKDRGAPPPPSATRQASVATPADDTAEDEDELAGDGNTAASVVKRRRIATRN
ncbi:hypothetical protein VFPPC_02065 [Pochonia chlamydosporia 170]|uniref:Bromo domain-containing protein n=1 Tax=Pochonia chlamydosporia 170 TaxID=1380566 RepID=A0A179F6V7_METCM|nr:hypothetical protein VFPPC_02065 [Pochonia chlamydosporia 170]OAQ61040.1 hypothetical protein VFPPC_02065 [Pochonia chlamydosporia 170]